MRHWAAEIGNWRNELLQRVTPRLRGRIDMDLLWRRAVRQADLDLAEQGRPAARARIRQILVHTTCPIPLDDLCSESGSLDDLVARIASAAAPAPKRR